LSEPWHHAPPAGVRSGIADYAATLDRALAPLGQPPVDLYHLGNNGLHAQIYQRALEHPGVAVLHDAVLHHFLLWSLSREQYIAEFVYNYGEWSRHLAEDLWEGRSSAGVDPRYFRFGMLRRIMERSRAVIVHNPGAARIALEHSAPGSDAAKIHVIPHFFEPADIPDHADTARFREQLGIGQGAILFGIFGYLRETKRVLTCLRAFRELNSLIPETALLLAGEPVSRDLRMLLDAEAPHPAIFRLGHLSEQELLTAAASIDCCLNLRSPAAGETSGIAIRMMGMGKPVIVTEGQECLAIPPAACLRVSPGVAEAAALFDHMVMVSRFPGSARDIGLLARRHILQHHSLDEAARQYWQVLCSAGS